MSIVSSTISMDIDLGYARLVEDRFVDGQGNVYAQRRHVPIGYDAAADLPARTALFEAMLAEIEATQVIV